MDSVRPIDRDPYLGMNFVVEIEGLTVAAFSEVTGLQVETEVHDYREGGLNEYMHKLAGPTRYPTNLTLKHGLTSGDELWKWHQDVRQGKIVRKNVSIVLLDAAHQEKWRWNFEQALPVRWNGPDLRADRAEVAIESVELVHRGLQIRG
jgi:phage tail-like protein